MMTRTTRALLLTASLGLTVSGAGAQQPGVAVQPPPPLPYTYPFAPGTDPLVTPGYLNFYMLNQQAIQLQNQIIRDMQADLWQQQYQNAQRRQQEEMERLRRELENRRATGR